MNMESIYEYGARAGFWRLRRILPNATFAFRLWRGHGACPSSGGGGGDESAGWEIASHGWRWIDYSFMDEKTECEHLKKALETHIAPQSARRPLDGIIGRTSPNTRRLLWKWANGFMTPTVMPMTCLIGRRAKTASRI